MDCTIEFSVFCLRIVALVKIDIRLFSEMSFLWHENNEQVYKIKLLKAWDYARTIFQSEKLQISYIKAEKDTRKHIFDILKVQKSSRRGLLSKIFDKLRIQGRMQIFEKKSQNALNLVLIG